MKVINPLATGVRAMKISNRHHDWTLDLAIMLIVSLGLNIYLFVVLVWELWVE